MSVDQQHALGRLVPLPIPIDTLPDSFKDRKITIKKYDETGRLIRTIRNAIITRIIQREASLIVHIQVPAQEEPDRHWRMEYWKILKGWSYLRLSQEDGSVKGTAIEEYPHAIYELIPQPTLREKIANLFRRT